MGFTQCFGYPGAASPEAIAYLSLLSVATGTAGHRNLPPLLLAVAENSGNKPPERPGAEAARSLRERGGSLSLSLAQPTATGSVSGPAQQRCEGCDNLFGEYYCDICHLFDRDKKQYHCGECGICRIGPKEDFFHCSKCNLCLSLSLRGKHKCIENVSRQDCPICLEDIHTSRVGAHVLPCGHLLHRTCYEDMLKEGYRCPLCMHSALDMTRYWRQLDDEVAQTPMPTEYQNMMVEILCNDCNARSTVPFHLLGMKCKNCESYNTAQDGRCRLPLEEQ
ncbi:PREDICTED: RING finger and CHY zinc finger domain-containing protein 1 [Charadrius vociferus]|uniref:RING finger and CHY zinc finger domain-containing protein 1 n=1 Tax=Charadrius vociferus TaxID=50402 RepID=UPI00052189E5|nr:PREDICTED: RING finger and CHY zinc finger domain-containing protein 1 [Charadrius vociferus]